MSERLVRAVLSRARVYVEMQHHPNKKVLDGVVVERLEPTLRRMTSADLERVLNAPSVEFAQYLRDLTKTEQRRANEPVVVRWEATS